MSGLDPPIQGSTRGETRHQIYKIPLRKRTFTEHIAKKMSDKQQSHPSRRFLPPFRRKKMIFSETKRDMKTKDDKMLTLERYFESCRRDLSRCLSWTKRFGLYQTLAHTIASHDRKCDFLMAATIREKYLPNKA